MDYSKNENLIFVGYFFTHKNHRGMSEGDYEAYYGSAVKFLNFFKNSFFITDSYGFQKILEKKPDVNKDNIMVMELEDTNTYKKYYDLLSKKFNNHNEIKTKVIWHFKFELLKICKEKRNTDYYCYIDSGTFRDHRHQANNFVNSNFKIAHVNDVVINYKVSYMNMDINHQNLFDHGHYETPCNSMLFSKKFINILEKEYFEKLDNLIESGVNTTEQRVLTVILRKYWKTNPEFFKIIESDDTYEINFYKD